MTSGEKSAKTRQANALKLVNQWNALYPIGTAVTVELDSGEWPAYPFQRIRSTTTRSNAQMLRGHMAVIWLEGFEGCYLLSRVRPEGGPHAAL